VGPTVDAIRLDNTFSILAFLLGRGFHGLVGLLPMLLGVILGTARTNHLAGRVAFAWGRWLATAVLALFLLILAVLIALPATTPPILGTDGNPVVGSIAELTTIAIGGHEQALMIRGYDVDKPVLLYLSGGPGQSSLPWPRVLFEELTRDFILVAWDQPGTGKSYAALSPASNMTPERVVADTVEVTNYLRERFDEEKIYLLGESWGTTLAVLAAQQRPDLYHAIISSGQMVSQRETDRRLYYDVLDYAARTGNETLAAQMEAYGEPPYQDLAAYIFVMGYYEALYKPYTLPPAYVEKGTQANFGPWNVLGSEYNLVEKVNVLRGFLDMASVLYPQLQDIDFRQDVPRLETAVYLLDGAAELSARRDLALEWYDLLEAPLKRIYTFENAAHAVAFEQFEAFQQIMVETVLPETYTNK
jgi:pimeloyl-ACP methyl ester carboxylesterase